MTLEYFWIGSFRNIRQQEFNLGGPFIYSARILADDRVEIQRSKNDNYIEGFFNLNGSGFTNVSAIVGENGSGKTNTLDFIRGIIANSFIAHDRGRKIVIEEFISIFRKGNGQLCILKNVFDKVVECTFPVKSIDQVSEDIITIFYSPVYDFRIFPVNFYEVDIDVSSNYLIDEDYDREKHASESISQVDMHKYANVARQISFMNSISRNSETGNRINIPEYAEVLVNFNTIERGSNTFWNSPYEFRPFFEVLDKIHRNEINALAQEEHRLAKGGDRQKRLNVQKEMFVSWALYYLLRNLFSNIEKSNNYLQEGRVSCPIEKLEALSLNEGIALFLRNQNLFPKSETFSLIEEINKIKDHIVDYDDGPQDIKKVKIPLVNVFSIQIAYSKYLHALYEIAGHGLAYSFLNFDLQGLSTGEKAYIDLFSRINYAKEKIYRALRDLNRYPSIQRFPRMIILLLDEGEIGFHLQWQKEYLKLLIQIIPSLFENEQVEIQLIFTSHSPISLSDIPHQNIIYVKKEGRFAKVLIDEQKPQHSFAANVHDLMHDAFYLKSGFMGDFAERKIQDAINWCLDSNTRQDDKVILKVISLIDEPIIKVKLSEMYAAKMGNSVEIARLEAQRDYILERLKDLYNDSN